MSDLSIKLFIYPYKNTIRCYRDNKYGYVFIKEMWGESNDNYRCIGCDIFNNGVILPLTKNDKDFLGGATVENTE